MLGEPRMGRARPTATRPPPGPTAPSCPLWDLPRQACLWGCVLHVHRKSRLGPRHMTQKTVPIPVHCEPVLCLLSRSQRRADPSPTAPGRPEQAR